VNGRVSEMTWDRYFLELAQIVSRKSKCHSRKVGCVIAAPDHTVLSVGYNGPPRQFPHCPGPPCPRREMGYKSGEGLEYCPATHAEVNAIVNAARVGVSLRGATLYLNTVFPCKWCMGAIINAGIKEVVVPPGKGEFYDELSRQMATRCGILLREGKY